jgi:hypothetical protein
VPGVSHFPFPHECGGLMHSEAFATSARGWAWSTSATCAAKACRAQLAAAATGTKLFCRSI